MMERLRIFLPLAGRGGVLVLLLLLVVVVVLAAFLRALDLESE